MAKDARKDLFLRKRYGDAARTTGYFLFLDDYMKTHKGGERDQAAKEAGRQWREVLTDQERQEWNQKAKETPPKGEEE